MSNLPFWKLLTFSLTVLIGTACWADEPSRMATYDHEGETYFALSLKADLATDVGPCDIVVLFDTSASQSGVYRDDSFAAFQSMLDQLNKQHNVRLYALDLEAVPMGSQFAAVGSSELKQSIAQLNARLPLGSTDMIAGLKTAMAALRPSTRPKRVVYIGDGVSKANLLQLDEFQALIDQLVAAKISVSSFAIGPHRDIQLLSTIANHTGGNTILDDESTPGVELGSLLAQSVKAEVFWPGQVELPEAVVEQFPRMVPPIRADRDSILVGVIHRQAKLNLQMDGEGNGSNALTWTIQPEEANEDFAYLPRLVDLARRDDGLSMPTAGSAALREVRRMIVDGAEALSQMSGRAFAMGDYNGAAKLAEAALKTDPSHMKAGVIQGAVQKKANQAQVSGTQFEVDGDSPVILLGEPEATEQVQFTEPPPAPMPGEVIVEGDMLGSEVVPQGIVDNGFVFEQPLEFEVQPEGYVEMRSVSSAPVIIDDVPRAFDDENGRLIDSVEAKRRAREGLLRAEVRNGIRAARDGMSNDPEMAVRDLKIMLENVKRAPDISGDARLQLRNQVEGAIRAGLARQFEKERRDQFNASNRARALERDKIAKATRREEEQLSQILDRFNSLLEEGRYGLAEEAALAAEEISPRRVEPLVAVLAGRYSGRAREMHRINDLKRRAFYATLATIEESSIPFPDEPPLVYPPAEEWEALTARRKKYASVDLSTVKESEQHIFEELDRPTEVDFFETPLSDAFDTLAEFHNINIELNSNEFDNLGVDTGTPITKTYNGVSLRSAMRLILREYDLTFVVRDEVLVITSVEDAEQELVTRVYPVGDLVLPISSGLGFGLGGQAGGFGGGGGGLFAVDGELKVGVKANSPSATVKPTAPQTVPGVRVVPAGYAGKVLRAAPANGQTSAEAWNALFAQQAKLAPEKQITARDVAATARHYMQDEQYETVVEVIHGALANGYPQPWMFEAMGLALQAKNAPKKDIERALMSAVDFSSRFEELYFAATYMSRIGLEKRAIQLMRDASSMNPTDPAPYALALRLARRIGDTEGMRWASVGVLTQAWPKGTENIAAQAERTARAVLEELEQGGQTSEAKELEQAVTKALERDVYATVTWSGDADVDICVQEPNGSVCSLNQQRTTGGGVLLADDATTKEKPEAREIYVCPKGFAGKYKLMIKPIYGKVDGGKVTVEIGRHQGSQSHQSMKKQIAVGDEPVVVAFELDQGRRQQEIEEAQVATIAKAQEAIDHAVLGQVVGVSDADDLIAAALARDRGLVGRLRSAVGFRPVITTFPQGTNFTATAVISADRRYVRISPQPTFSGVSEVSTFNFATGDDGLGGGGAGGGLGGF